MEPVPLPPRDVHPQFEDPPHGIEALIELHTRLDDTVAGFKKVVEKAEPDFRPVARDFLALHSDHARAVAGMLAHDGHDPAQDGSVFGAVNRALVQARSWFDTVDVNIMDALVQGEKHVLEAFEGAIESAEPAERRNALVAMRDAQIALMDKHCPPT